MISAYDAKKESVEDTVGETQLSEKAQTLLEKLRDTYEDMDFFVADFSKGDNVKDILSKAGKEFFVILTVEELEKMASDEKYGKEYMEKVQGARRMSEQINREYGVTPVSGEAEGRIKVSKIGISINEWSRRMTRGSGSVSTRSGQSPTSMWSWRRGFIFKHERGRGRKGCATAFPPCPASFS